jgi:transcription-repair coupling factor
VKTRIATAADSASQSLALFHSPLFTESKALLCILENNKEIKTWLDLLKLWSAELNFDAKKIITWPDTTEASLETLLALHRLQDSIVLTTKNNLDSMTPKWSALNENKITLRQNEYYHLHALTEDLLKIGFERHSQAFGDFTFSIRGSVVDIFQDNKIFRLNYDENKIEKIIYFAADLEYAEHTISEIDIWPKSTYHKETFITSLPEQVLLVADTDISLDNNLNNSQIIFDPLGKEYFKTESIDNILGQQKNYYHFLEQKKNEKIIWLTKNKFLAEKLIKENNIKCSLYDWQQALSWPPAIYAEQQTIILVNDSLFFAEDKNNDYVAQEFRSDFTIGDLVVHRDHGIALLKEMTTMPVDGLIREYFVLSYAENDTLFVPVDLADKLEKYIGPANPKIHRLSVGNTWPQTLRKIKDQTWELANQLLLVEATRKLQKSPILKAQKIEAEIVDSFPYTLTPSQDQAIQETLNDLKQPYPSDRLVCGDVGFGKTEVAIRAASRVVANGFQVALLCPTTLLAQQHYDNFVSRFQKSGVKVVLMTRWQKEKEIQSNLTSINDGTADIIIGTHRLLSRDINFPKLQLLIIDEEQNFGVKDKEKLKKHRANIHLLTLTATPIPRTLNMALSMIKDISLINDPIKNRKDIITKVVEENDQVVVEAITQELARQGQVYYLYNQVETIDLAYKKLKSLLPKIKVAIAHGQLEDEKLASVMHDFDTGQIDVLLCSTIIANGLDIPRANTLLVHKANRFGLSQLHQLRGRIGRSDRQAYAYFMHSSEKLPKLASQRLGFLKQASHLGEGFKVANKDLELRGVGQILGQAQSGKVKTIGLGLYQQLISETIREIKGQPVKYWRDVEIKLPIDTSLPIDFKKSIAEKIIFYQKISQERDVEKIEKNIHETSNKNISALWHLQKIKILCQAKDIINISTQKSQTKNWLVINFIKQPNLKNISLLQESNPHWLYQNLQIKIEFDYLAKNLLTSLESTINIL